MASHMTKLMRRLASAGIEPRFEVCAVDNTYKAHVPLTWSGEGSQSPRYWVGGDTPEAAITRAVEGTLAMWLSGQER